MNAAEKRIVAEAVAFLEHTAKTKTDPVLIAGSIIDAVARLQTLLDLSASADARRPVGVSGSRVVCDDGSVWVLSGEYSDTPIWCCNIPGTLAAIGDAKASEGADT